MNPMHMSTTGATVAAMATSETEGAVRWTELRVFHYSVPKIKRCWLAEVRAVSTVEGERDKVRRLASASLEKALTLFDDTTLGRAAMAEAREWAEDMGLPMRTDPQTPPTDPVEALGWLFGCERDDVNLRAVGRTLGVGESTMRQAIAAGREIKVPLASLLPFVDRAGFQRSVAAAASRDAREKADG